MTGNNIIRQQYVQLDFNGSASSPFAIQQTSSAWCHERLLPAIGKALEKYAAYDEVIRINHINIDMDEGSDPFNQLLADKIATSIDELIRRKISESNKGSKEVLNNQTSVVESLFFFLQHGYLPWWSSIRSIHDFNEAWRELTQGSMEQHRQSLGRLLMDNQISLRFVTSLHADAFTEIISLITGIPGQAINKFLDRISLLATIVASTSSCENFIVEARQVYLNDLIHGVSEVKAAKQIITLLGKKYKVAAAEVEKYLVEYPFSLMDEVAVFIDDKKSDDPLDEVLEVPDAPASDLLKEEKKRTIQNDETELQKYKQKTEGIYIDNAGVVLLAPFLPAFFETVGLQVDGIIVNKDLAVAALQWLVSGDEQYAPFQLVLPKLLCGLQPEDVVVIFPALPEIIKKEGINLLEAVIKHWSVLGNTSVAGLRESFLTRDGKLSLKRDEWCLQVEQKPFDMLLQNLPWNISMIRLSWMPQLLRTEWVN